MTFNKAKLGKVVNCHWKTNLQQGQGKSKLQQGQILPITRDSRQWSGKIHPHQGQVFSIMIQSVQCVNTSEFSMNEKDME